MGERVFELAARIVEGLGLTTKTRAGFELWGWSLQSSSVRASGFPRGARNRSEPDRCVFRGRLCGGAPSLTETTSLRYSAPSAHLSSETRTIYYVSAAKSRQGGAFLATAVEAAGGRPHHRVGCGGFVVGAGFAVGFGSAGAGFFTAGLGSSKVSVK